LALRRWCTFMRGPSSVNYAMAEWRFDERARSEMNRRFNPPLWFAGGLSGRRRLQWRMLIALRTRLHFSDGQFQQHLRGHHI
jgi:hypothetical protein